MKCTIKEQENCDVEKRGCKGCYYDISKLEKIKNKCFTFKILKRRCKNGEKNFR